MDRKFMSGFGASFALFSSLCLSTASYATVTFKDGPFRDSVEVGATLKLSMESLLVAPAPKNVYWRVQNLPSWLRYDKAEDLYVGVPSCKDLGASNVDVSVVEPGVNAAKTNIEVSVFSSQNCAPQWYDGDQLDEYELPADEPLVLEFKNSDILKRAYDPEGQPLQVKFTSLPGWLDLTQGPDGSSVFFSGKATKEQLLQNSKLEVTISDGITSTVGFITLTLFIQ